MHRHLQAFGIRHSIVFSGPGPTSSYPPAASPIDARAVPLSAAPPKFTPHWKRDLPAPATQPNSPSELSSRVGPFMERRSTVSGPATQSTLGVANGFPPPATSFPSSGYPSTRSVSPEPNPSTVIERPQTSIHRAQTHTSSGRRPLPSIGNRSPPVPPLPGPSSNY
ncbi:hypothetical protein DFH29DRAFT_323149 [Suillus ampliporus]|nr:hypothetical protein DFH29DRAFT_323149 [Suillus ampliporus]